LIGLLSDSMMADRGKMASMVLALTPMLAAAGSVLPGGPGWAYEFKWDGVRALVNVVAGTVRITSRLGNEVTAAYPELAGLGAGIEDALVDGEIVAFVDDRPSFGQLQLRMHVRSARQAAALVGTVPVSFIAFDLLRLYGVDLTARPLSERRATLDRLAVDHPQWTVSPSFDDGPATEAAARAHGLEGVVAKRLAGVYLFGYRTDDWVKVKFTRGGEFVVVGWEADAADGSATLSSLLLAYHDGDELRFAGKVGSGLSGPESGHLKRRLVTRPRPPLAELPPASPGRVATWVEPEVVVAVTYSHWADDGRLRHPVFVGIRNDKDAREVVRDG
jgi:bifunctional non-homologous end joining protein LigD